MKELNTPLDHAKKHQYWSGKGCPAIMIKRNGWNTVFNGTKVYYNNNSGNQNQLKGNSEIGIATTKVYINNILIYKKGYRGNRNGNLKICRWRNPISTGACKSGNVMY